jgi:hypothetical protein
MAKQIDPSMTVDMKMLAMSKSKADRALFNALMKIYYPRLSKAFPDKSEIENKSTYVRYLKDPNFQWTMLILRSSDGDILGGIQYQKVMVGGVWLQSAIWGEHIWLVDPVGRSYTNFMALLKIARERFEGSGAQMLFFEFNDRAKMSFGQMVEDAKGGLPTEAREVLWGRAFKQGFNLALDASGSPAVYAQPGMDGEAPVTYLSLLFASLTGKPLNRLLLSDYLMLLQAAHRTISGVDLATDETVVAYREQIAAQIASGEQYLDFVPLAQTRVARLVNARFAKTRRSFEHATGSLERLSKEQLIAVIRELTSAPTETDSADSMRAAA